MKFYTADEISQDILSYEKQDITVNPVNMYDPSKEIVFICKYSDFYKQPIFDPILIEDFFEAVGKFMTSCAIPRVLNVPELTKQYRVFGFVLETGELEFAMETDLLHEVRPYTETDKANIKYVSFTLVDMNELKVTSINQTIQ